MITRAKITESFCIADDFCKEFDNVTAENSQNTLTNHKTKNRKGQLSKSEVLTILICYHFGSLL
ncbi:hypothetical protein BN938_0914 [Mucinivorans hirudinis]|uniref:Mobile element protein n=1 Tax=Mucinivorans hirudinis TaxID=1433126 RepID=A0A060RC89_9BACT|nr:hypothetical protein BN938_0914 [Mucinivorans hirudinis]